MTEGESNLFDLIYPSPPTLQQLSSITISLQLCRYDLSKRRLNGTLDKFGESISIKEILPNLPTDIETMIRKQTEILRSSIVRWEDHQYRNIFQRDRDFESNRILKVFDDFVCDFDGDIHYTKTAKLMMLSDEFTKMEKFQIACSNCFEDEIRLLWPSVSKDMNDELCDYEDELRYWQCFLKNEMDQFFISDLHSDDDDESPDSIDEYFFDHCVSSAGSTEYFWNRLPLENRSAHIVHFSRINPALFSRFYLPKLNEHQLSEFITQDGGILISNLLKRCCCNSPKLHYTVPTFMYIKDKISNANFCRMVRKLMKNELHYDPLRKAEDIQRSYVCCEIWNNAPCDFKSSAVEYIFSSDDLSFETSDYDLRSRRPMIFLRLLLQNATFEQRSVFWHKHWLDLVSAARFEDFFEIMKLCVSNEADIAEFSENTMANCGNFRQYCFRFMRVCNFSGLEDFLKFWFPDVRSRRELKQRLLQSFVFESNLIPWHAEFHAVEELDLFINDAFDDIELANDFKNRVVSSPNLISALTSSISECRFASLMKFIDMFENESTQQVIAQIKTGLMEALKIVLKNHTFWETKRDGLNEFLAWCLGSEDRVAEFKRSFPVNEVFLDILRKIISDCMENRESAKDIIKERSFRLTEYLMWTSTEMYRAIGMNINFSA